MLKENLNTFIIHVYVEIQIAWSCYTLFFQGILHQMAVNVLVLSDFLCEKLGQHTQERIAGKLFIYVKKLMRPLSRC